MTVDLVAFLRARLDKDEQAAQAVGCVEIEAVDHLWETKYLNLRQPDGEVRHTAEFSAELADHIARHDPARVLAEVDAKRQIVAASNADCLPGCAAEHTFSGSCALRWMGPASEAGGTRWVHDAVGAAVPAPPATTGYVLRLLALPYREHPDYQPEWAPDMEGRSA